MKRYVQFPLPSMDVLLSEPDADGVRYLTISETMLEQIHTEYILHGATLKQQIINEFMVTQERPASEYTYKHQRDDGHEHLFEDSKNKCRLCGWRADDLGIPTDWSDDAAS